MVIIVIGKGTYAIYKLYYSILVFWQYSYVLIVMLGQTSFSVFFFLPPILMVETFADAKRIDVYSRKMKR